jgi:galactose mutarotase-like enzyme
MSVSHRPEERGERLLDVVTDEESGVRLIISRLGAELVSMARKSKTGEWIGFLIRDNDLTPPAHGWVNHATVMGYFLHRLKGKRSLYRSQEIKGDTHSFLRTKVWHLVESGRMSEGSITYRITPADFTPTEYPLKVSLDLTYRIVGQEVVTEFEFRNDEPKLTAHVGFGLHPGFAAASFDSFQFQMPPGKYRRHFAPGNFLSGETQDIDFGGGKMPFRREELPDSFIIELLDVPNSKFTFLDAPSGREVDVDFTGVPYLTLWSNGGPFLCVEPCWGLTDFHEQRHFEEKEGMQVIAPLGKLKAHFSMSPRLTA